MPQWMVEGAEKLSGKETTLLVEAPDATRARQVASDRGLLVAEVKPSDEHATISAPPLAYRVPGGEVAPSLDPLRKAAIVLRILGFVHFAIALFLVAVTINSMYGRYRYLGVLSADFAWSVIYAGLIATLGAACQTGSALLMAHRETLMFRRKTVT